MKKIFLADLLALTFLTPQMQIFAEAGHKEKDTTIVREYLVKYKTEQMIDDTSDIMTIDDKREVNLKIEEKFKKHLPNNSKIKIKDELKHDKKGRKTQLMEIESSENNDVVLEKLRNMEGVEYAEPNYKIDKLYDPGFEEQWGLNSSTIYDINTLHAWEMTYGSSDVTVAVMDTGIDINHPDLEGNIVSGWNFTDYVNDTQNGNSTVYKDAETDEHGTHIAGIIAAAQNNIGIQGVAPNVKIMPLKILDEDGGTVFHAIKAIEYAEEHGVKIANCSWGNDYYSQFLYDAMKQSDILFVCASGNDGYDFAETKSYPAAYDLDNIISVAAINSNGELCEFSNYGEGVDIAAPGENIYSTLPEGEYGNMDGTSMAAPFVTGVAALIKSVSPESLAVDIKERILESATSHSVLDEKVETGGYLNSSGAVWTRIEPNDMTEPRYGAEYVEVGGELYTIGGYDGEKYIEVIKKFNMEEKSWDDYIDLPYAMAKMSIVEHDNKIYIFGGRNNTVLNNVQIFDTEEYTITAGADMPTGIYSSACTVFEDKAYIFGGISDDGYSNKVYVYDFINNTWEEKQDLPFSFAYGQAVTVNDTIYIIGGTDGSKCMNEIYRYDVADGSVTLETQMQVARKDFGAVVFKDEVYIFGGSASYDENGENVLLGEGIENGFFSDAILDSVEKYNIYEKVCEKIDTLECAAIGIKAIEYLGNIYLIGGWNGNYLADVSKYFWVEYPQNIQMKTADDGETVNVQWSKINDATGYEIEICGEVFIATQNEYEFLLNQFSEEYDLPIRVRAVKNGTCSLWSEVVYFSRNSSMFDAKYITFDFSIFDKLYQTGQSKWYRFSTAQAGIININIANVSESDNSYLMQLRNSSGEVIAESTDGILNFVVTEYNYYITVTATSCGSDIAEYNLGGGFTASEGETNDAPDRIKAFLAPSYMDDNNTGSELFDLDEYTGEDEPEMTEDYEEDENTVKNGDGGVMGTDALPETEENSDESLTAYSTDSATETEPTVTEDSLSFEGDTVSKSVSVTKENIKTGTKMKLVIAVVPENEEDEFAMEWTGSNTEYSNFRWNWEGDPKRYYLTALLPKSSVTRTYKYKITYETKAEDSEGKFKIYTYMIVDDDDNEDFNSYTGNDVPSKAEVISVTTGSETSVTGKLDHPQDKDFYKVSVSKNQKLTAVLNYPDGKCYSVVILDHEGESSDFDASQYMTGWYREEEKISWCTIHTGSSSRDYIIKVQNEGTESSSVQEYTLRVYRHRISSLGKWEINDDFSDDNSNIAEFTDDYLGTTSKTASAIDFCIDSPADEDLYKIEMNKGDKISVQMNMPEGYNDSTHQYRIGICSDVEENEYEKSWLDRRYNNPNSAHSKSVTFIAEKAGTHYVSVKSLTREYDCDIMGTLIITKTASSYFDSNEKKNNECSNDYIYTSVVAFGGVVYGVRGYTALTDSISANFDNELDVDWYSFENNSKENKNISIYLSGSDSVKENCGFVVLDREHKLLATGDETLTYSIAPYEIYYIGAYVKDGKYINVTDDREYTINVQEMSISDLEYNGGKGFMIGDANALTFKLNRNAADSARYYIVPALGWNGTDFYNKTGAWVEADSKTEEITIRNIEITNTTGETLYTKIRIYDKDTADKQLIWEGPISGVKTQKYAAYCKKIELSDDLKYYGQMTFNTKETFLVLDKEIPEGKALVVAFLTKDNSDNIYLGDGTYNAGDYIDEIFVYSTDKNCYQYPVVGSPSSSRMGYFKIAATDYYSIKITLAQGKTSATGYISIYTLDTISDKSEFTKLNAEGKMQVSDSYLIFNAPEHLTSTIKGENEETISLYQFAEKTEDDNVGRYIAKESISGNVNIYWEHLNKYQQYITYGILLHNKSDETVSFRVNKKSAYNSVNVDEAYATPRLIWYDYFNDKINPDLTDISNNNEIQIEAGKSRWIYLEEIPLHPNGYDVIFNGIINLDILNGKSLDCCAFIMKGNGSVSDAETAKTKAAEIKEDYELNHSSYIRADKSSGDIISGTAKAAMLENDMGTIDLSKDGKYEFTLTGYQPPKLNAGEIMTLNRYGEEDLDNALNFSVIYKIHIDGFEGKDDVKAVFKYNKFTAPAYYEGLHNGIYLVYGIERDGEPIEWDSQTLLGPHYKNNPSECTLNLDEGEFNLYIIASGMSALPLTVSFE